MKRAALIVAAILAGGCATGAGLSPHAFDLGIGAPAARIPAVRVAQVRAAAPFDGVEMHYRLAWRNASELASFARSRWAAPPAELLRKQLLRAVGDGVAKCGLEIELQEFSQVFGSPAESEARIELRAALAGAKGRVAARGWSLSEPNGGADAAGGAAALVRATDRLTGEIAAWVSAQPDCR